MLKANAAYHQVEVPDAVERAYVRVIEPIVKPVKPVSISEEPAQAASAKAVQVALPAPLASVHGGVVRCLCWWWWWQQAAATKATAKGSGASAVGSC